MATLTRREWSSATERFLVAMGSATRKALLASALAILTATAAGGLFGHAHLASHLPAEGRAARGVEVDGHAVPSGADPRAFVEGLADARLDHPVQIRAGDASLGTITLRQLGASAAVDWTLERMMAVGRVGTWEERVLESMRVAEVGADVALPIEVPVERVAAILEPVREALDRRAKPARRRGGADAVTPHEDGVYLDAYATADALLGAAARGDAAVEVASYRWVPAATADAARAAALPTVLARFETRFGGPPGRDKNIERAADRLDGLVLMPGETVSFNEVVGPRSTDNGFFPAPEIYKGEMRQGIGGGVCQVASTLYAAAFFGGLDVVDRQNHSRPSGYIRPGLDATVSYPVLDLRIKNPFSFPIVLTSQVEPGRLSFAVRGEEQPVSVELATETAGILKYGRKLERAALPEGEFRLKQRGKRGMVIRRTKTITRVASGERVVEESKDTYPAQTEVFLVGPKTDESLLPPLEDPTAPSGA